MSELENNQAKKGNQMSASNWNKGFKAWQDFARNIDSRAKAISEHRRELGWELAASVGIPRCGCSLHNASIDHELTGWCANNPKRLKVAKRANWMVNEWAWEPTTLAHGIVGRAYDKFISQDI